MKRRRIRVGLRTVKTAVAIIIAMVLVEPYGATSSRLILAMLGAMAAVQPTFKESLEACVTQTVGVLFGAAAGVLLAALPMGPLTSVLLGIIFVISVYNLLPDAFSPSLPCFILVMICTDAEMAPIPYALGRIWDTAIGLGVGMLINSLVFPYDNSRQIRETADGLDRDLLLFLEDMFDGNSSLPDTDAMNKRIATLEGQLVRLADHIAYINHDIEDALRGGVIYPMEIPVDAADVLGFTHSQRIDTLVTDAIESSRGQEEVRQSPRVGEAMLALKEFMFDNVYTNPMAKGEEGKAQDMLRRLFEYYQRNPDCLPGDFQAIRAEEGVDRAVCDYIAGMTDPFAVDRFQELFIPKGWTVL